MLIGFSYIAHGSAILSPIKYIGGKAKGQFKQLKENIGLKNNTTKKTAPQISDQEIFKNIDMNQIDNIVTFLSTTNSYKGYHNAQKAFLNRAQGELKLNEKQKDRILSMVAAREAQDK